MDWIPTAERLPEPMTCVLVYLVDDPAADEPIVDLAEYTVNGDWRLIGIDTPLSVSTVSHWMPLPQAPMVDSQ